VRGEVSRRARLALAVALTFALVAGPAAAQPCPECLQAGAARATLGVPPGTPLAGYGGGGRRAWLPDIFGRHPHAFWLRPSGGERDALAARALVLDAGGPPVVWVAVDLLAVDRAFTAEVERRLHAAGIRPAALVLSASHTHSGPGAFVDSAVLGWLALDRLDGTVREALVEAVVAAVRQAVGASRPARLAVGSVATPRLVRSRLGQPSDSELLVLRVVAAGGAPIALVWNYAIHGTTLGSRNLRVSGDVMGEASRRLEAALGVPALFVNGAVGDVSPARHGEQAAVDLGTELAAAAQAGWAQAEPIERPTLAVGRRTVALPPPGLPLRNCLGGWFPRTIRFPLGAVFPREATLTAVVVGDVGWVTFPGELQTSLGLGIKQTAGLRRVLVAGVSNDYLGYFLSAADYERPTYVSCSTLYGAHAGTCLAEAASALLAAVARGEASTGTPLACDR
jgi:neutral ceramidase